MGAPCTTTRAFYKNITFFSIFAALYVSYRILSTFRFARFSTHSYGFRCSRNCCQLPPFVAKFHTVQHTKARGENFFGPERVLGGARGKTWWIFSQNTKKEKKFTHQHPSAQKKEKKFLTLKTSFEHGATVSNSFVCEYTRTQTVKQSISARLSLRHLYS